MEKHVNIEVAIMLRRLHLKVLYYYACKHDDIPF
mgnify:CR=1 FL=1